MELTKSEGVWRASKFCEAFDIQIPDEYEVTSFRAPVHGETFLTVYGNVTLCTVDRYGQPHPILRRIGLPVTYRTPTDEDARIRPTVEVRDTDIEEWRPATLLAVQESQLSERGIESDYTFVTLRAKTIEFWNQCRMKEN